MEPSVLIVDDDPNVARALWRELRTAGFSAAAATDAPSALRHLERTPVDVLMSDLMMPNVDGVELLTEVRRRWPGVMRVAITGSIDAQPIVQALNAGGISMCFSKPWNGPAVARSLRDEVDRRRLAAGANGLEPVRIVRLSQAGGAFSSQQAGDIVRSLFCADAPGPMAARGLFAGGGGRVTVSDAQSDLVVEIPVEAV